MADFRIGTGFVQDEPGEPCHTREQEAISDHQTRVKFLLRHFNIVPSPRSWQERGPSFPQKCSIKIPRLKVRVPLLGVSESFALTQSRQDNGRPCSCRGESLPVGTALSGGIRAAWPLARIYSKARNDHKILCLSDTAVNFFDIYFYINVP